MPIYVIACDLKDPASKAGHIDQALRKQLPECLRPLPTTWIVEGATSAHMLYQTIEDHLTHYDGVVIVRAGSEAHWARVAPATEGWMAERFTRDQ